MRTLHVLSEALTTLYQTFQEAAAGWVSGDLMTVSTLQQTLDDYLANEDFSALPEEQQKLIVELHDSVLDLLEPSKEHAWISKAATLAPPTPADQGGDSPKISSASAPTMSQQAAPQQEPDEFEHIIRDAKMLGQLCDEVKEHMEIAQYTLVDLEFDSTNPETINKIFRAFHTIKSSAAFLGLRNLEESAHAIEDVMVLVRDRALPIDKDLINVIFYGVGLLKDLVGIIEASDFQVDVMIESFRQIDIKKSIEIFRKIHREHGSRKIGEILQESGRLDSSAIARILEQQKLTKRKFGEIAVEENLISPEELRSSLQHQLGTTRRSSVVKVSNERLNTLIDLVGELVVNQSMLRQSLQNLETGWDSGERTVAQLETITTNMKNLVLSMGMVPMTEIFNKLRVVIRNTAAETGKVVTVVFQGEDTELDRNVIETIYDPLVHLVRNAVDHGLEDPTERKRLGKAPMGTITISAEHRGGGIEILVVDDGKGIDREAILRKALSRELISQEQAASLDEKAIFSLIMLPGFSTRDEVTEVSGRGVGMDVVQQNITQIRGKVEIQSTKGAGSRFLLRIPLTLAIIDGFVAMIDQIKYVLPFNIIEEIIVPDPQALTKRDNGQLFFFDRNSYTPILKAAEIFGHPNWDRDWPLIVIFRFEDRRYGIFVDAVLGKQEIVIKQLNEALGNLDVFSGGTIFGDGSIGFVVDIEQFLAEAHRQEAGEDE